LRPNLQHGAFAKTRLPLTEAEEQEVEDLLSLPHTVPSDRAAAEEVVRLRSLIAGLDARIERRLRGNYEPSKLIQLRSTLSGRLLTYLESFGLTPKSRATWTGAITPSESRERLLGAVEARMRGGGGCARSWRS
jgi:hypothetical protein